MTNLRDHLQELAEAAARDGRTAGPAAAIRRGRQRRRRLTAGTAALLAAVLAAGAVGTGQLRLSNRQEAPAAPSTKPRFPAKLAEYAATVANGSAEAAVLGMLTDPDPRSEGLGACKGGRPTDVRIIAVGRLPDRQGVWMIAARPPLPNERRLCWMFAFGNQHRISSPVAYAGEPPLLTTLHANSSGDPSKLVVDGYVTKQAARVRFILAAGKPPLDLQPLQSGNDFPVNFFVAVVPWPGSKETLPVQRLIALDNSGREIASCWPERRDASSCGSAG
jgi:hypothetical protein